MNRLYFTYILLVMGVCVILFLFDQYSAAVGLLVGSLSTSLVLWWWEKGEGVRLARKWMKNKE